MDWATIYPVISSIEFRGWVWGVVRVSTYGLIDGPWSYPLFVLAVHQSTSKNGFRASIYWPRPRSMVWPTAHGSGHGSCLRGIFGVILGKVVYGHPWTTRTDHGSPYGLSVATVGCTYNFWNFEVSVCIPIWGVTLNLSKVYKHIPCIYWFYLRHQHCVIM